MFNAQGQRGTTSNIVYEIYDWKLAAEFQNQPHPFVEGLVPSHCV